MMPIPSAMAVAGDIRPGTRLVSRDSPSVGCPTREPGRWPIHQERRGERVCSMTRHPGTGPQRPVLHQGYRLGRPPHANSGRRPPGGRLLPGPVENDGVVPPTHGELYGLVLVGGLRQGRVITWESEETDLPSVGPDPRHASLATVRQGRRSPATPTRRRVCGIPTCVGCSSKRSARPTPSAAGHPGVDGGASSRNSTLDLAGTEPPTQSTPARRRQR